MIKLVNDDTVAYNKIIIARRLPKKTENQIKARDNKILSATQFATEIPFQILKNCSKISTECLNVCSKSNINSISDIGVATHSLKAASYGAYYNVLINILDLSIKERKYYVDESTIFIDIVKANHIKIVDFVENILNKNK